MENPKVMKSNLYASIGTATTCMLLFLLLWFYVLPFAAYVKPVEEEGIMVSFGDNEDGGGRGDNPEVEPALSPKPTQEVIQKQTVQPQTEEIITQKTDDSYAIAEKKKKEKAKQDQIVADNQRIENDKKVAEQKRKESAAIERASALNGVFGNSNSNGSGRGSGDTYQGNPAGKGSYGGNSYNVNGRSLTGTLVSPNYDQDVEGKITVNIRVDESGRVVSTTIGSPTTISDAATRKAAESAAKNTHFSAGKGISTGSITYKFNLK